MALAARRKSMAVGMARSPRWAARPAARNHGARSDPPGDVAAAGQAAWMAHRSGRREGTWVERSAGRAIGGSAGGGGRRLNYARRQQYRRLLRAGGAAVGSAAAVLLALVVGGARAWPLAGLLLLFAFGLGLYARRWLALAGRSRVGARSEDKVHRALAPLEADGWRLRHSLTWRGQGDIDSVAISPAGIAVVIETKTRTYDARHLARVREQATWLSRRRRRWSRHGALAVLCLVRVRGVERVEHDVLVVSLDRLVPLLSVAAGMRVHAAGVGARCGSHLLPE